MTTEQQNTLWFKYNSFRLRKAAQYKPAVYKALKEQLQYFADTRFVDGIPMDGIETIIKNIYTDVGRLWAHQTYLNVTSQSGKSFFVTMQTKGRMPIGFNEDFINSILEYFRLKLLNEAVFPILETTKDFIREILQKGALSGAGIDEMVREILSSDITLQRANLIARTETMKAANVGEQLGADKTGLQTNKIWISTRDNRTRLDHENVDNQVVPDGKPFIVGVEKYQMLRPGDGQSVDGRKVPAKEICNCRCVVGRKVLRGANGLPLRA